MFKNIQFNKALLINFANLNNEEKSLVREWRNHDLVRVWMYQEQIISETEHEEFLSKRKNDVKNMLWLVKSQQNYIGVISINKIDEVNHNAYIGIYTNPMEKAKGAGKILIDAVKYVAFENMKLHTLKLEVIATNDRAIHFYEKSGFVREGILKEFVYKNSARLDVIVMGIVKG